MLFRYMRIQFTVNTEQFTASINKTVGECMFCLTNVDKVYIIREDTDIRTSSHLTLENDMANNTTWCDILLFGCKQNETELMRMALKHLNAHMHERDCHGAF